MDTMALFHESDRQGYLLCNKIDAAIESQSSYEIEGALRSVMQLQNDIAVILCGSNDVIDEIGRSDRPFYLSFRVFRL